MAQIKTNTTQESISIPMAHSIQITDLALSKLIIWTIFDENEMEAGDTERQDLTYSGRQCLFSRLKNMADRGSLK